jgi:hypothetical protein
LAQKKTLDTAQNLENKQSGIFLPAKSMVLKVVKGKILETLELRRLSLLAVPFWNCRQGWRWPDLARGLPWRCIRYKVVKDLVLSCR